MAQKPFLMDKGIQVGDWYFTQNTDGDLKISSTAEVGVSQRPFRVDHGFKIGTMAWFITGEDFKASEDDSGLTQRPFLADAGIQVGDWVFSQNADYDVTISVGGSVLSGLYSSTAISSGTVGTYSGWSISGLDTANVDGTVTTSFEPGVTTFSSDGTYMFIQDDQTVYRAELSTAWDVTTAGAFTQVFVFGTNGTDLSEGCHWWSYDGMYFFQIVKYTAGDTELVIHRHAVGTAWDMTTYGGSYDEELRISHSSIQTVLVENSITGVQPQDFTRLKFSGGGTKIILISHSGHIIEFSTLSAWSASRSGSISYGSLSGYVEYLDISFNVTGTKCWVTARDGSGNVYIVEYYMATPWDWSSLTFNSEWNLGSFTGLPLCIWYYNGKLYFGGTDLNGGGTNFITSISLVGGSEALQQSYTYAIAITNSAGQAVTSVVEGGSYTLTVTTNAPSGSTVWMTAQEDIETGYSDPVTIDWLMDGTQSIARTATVTNGVATIDLDINADLTTETGYEKFRFVVSSSDDGAQFTGDGAGTTPWITIIDSSQDPAPDLTQYDWTFSTSVDIGAAQDANGDYYLMSNYSDPTVMAQLAEGDTSQTWTITTNAPDGTQVYAYQSGVFMGSYGYQDDPSNPYSEFYYGGSPSGWYTVQNGEISGTFDPISDGYAEDGEVVQFKIKDNSSWTYGEYNVLATTEYIHLIDTGSSTGSSGGSSGLSPEGTQILAGESHFDSGVPQSEWISASSSSTGNPQLRIRVNTGNNTQTTLDLVYWLDNVFATQYVYIDPYGSYSAIQATSGSTKTQIGTGNYYDYYFDVDENPPNGVSSTYFYSFMVIMP